MKMGVSGLAYVGFCLIFFWFLNAYQFYTKKNIKQYFLSCFASLPFDFKNTQIRQKPEYLWSKAVVVNIGRMEAYYLRSKKNINQLLVLPDSKPIYFVNGDAAF